MKKKTNHLPNKIPVFPLSNFIIFPRTTVPLNIFEPRYIDMIDDAMKSNRIIGMVQPKKSDQNIPILYNIGCAGKITSFNETNDGRYLIVLNGISRFRIVEELKNDKLYRECSVSFDKFHADFQEIKEEIKFADLELIFKDIKSLFVKEGYVVNWKDFEKQDFNQTINTLAMASPFTLEEKQILLETTSLNERKNKLEEILSTYVVDNFNNKTIQ
tara:strand:+ start:32 stop:676 length:645 start_codon:yes stop_codon:yes gene_type:complete